MLSDHDIRLQFNSENRIVATVLSPYRVIARAVVILAMCACLERIMANELPPSGPETFLGGPTSIPAQLDELVDDDDDTLLNRLETDYGLTMSADYAAMYQAANNVLAGDEQGASGVFRLYGTWTIYGQGTRNRGSIVAKVEHRHAYGSTAPADLASNAGYLGVNAIGFTDVGAFVAPLYWQQFFANGTAGLVAGRLDPLDFVDVLGIGSQWNSFQNAATIANLALPLPDLGCGVGAGKTFNGQWIVAVTAHDLNGAQTSMDCFPGGLDLFKQAYFGWSPSRAQRFNQAFVMTIWHADASDTGPDSGRGIALSANWTLAERWMPFIRVGIAEGAAAIMKSQVSSGLTYTYGNNRNQIGAAVSFQDPRVDALHDQTSFELYFRWQATPSLALAPNIQILHNPAFNPARSTIVLAGLRFRYSP
jgi:porin